MPLVAAITVLEQSVRNYQRAGHWEGVPPFLAAMVVKPLNVAQAIDLPPVIRPPVLLVRMLQEPVADSPRRCGAGRDYRSAASVQ